MRETSKDGEPRGGAGGGDGSGEGARGEFDWGGGRPVGPTCRRMSDRRQGKGSLAGRRRRRRFHYGLFRSRDVPLPVINYI